MRRLKQQQGIVTVLLVTLIGFSVMVSTGVVASKLVTQRNASVAAHAQTNSELLSWAGVSAFKHYLLAKGALDLTNISDLAGQNIPLFYDANKKEINVSNIRVAGCDEENEPCTISAEIHSKSMSAKSATVIEAVYKLAVVDGEVQVVDQSGNFNFGGNTSFSGSTVIDSEVPGSNVEINVDGDLSLNLGFKTKNIENLTINATGDVYIDCGSQNCGSATIHVTTQGKVTLVNGSNFGEIKSLGSVTLRIGAKAQDIRTASAVTMESGSEAGDIQAKGNVALSGGSKAKNITAEGDVTLSTSSADKVVANGSVFIDTGNATSVTTLKYLYMMTGAYVTNDVVARGDSTTTQSSTVYLISGAKVGGNIYAKGDVRLIAPFGVSQAHATGGVKNGLGGHSFLGGAGSYTENSLAAKNKTDALEPIEVDVSDIEEEVSSDQSKFDTRVDVTVYKSEANYIFTRETGASRVFLNNLKNEHSEAIYTYEHNAQFQINKDGEKESVSSNGFALGNYRLNGHVYTGAICEEVGSNGICESEIVGYLPRIAVDSTFGVNDSNSYVSISNTWYIRSLRDRSPVDNASLAPGIMYFDGNLSIAGHANWQADSQSNTFTNSFLAEGDIEAIAFSPRIYSPYNVLREGTEELTCNRRLKDVQSNDLNKLLTVPITESNYYLMATNLCKSISEFAYDMNKKEDGSQDYVTIDGEPIEKLDLGEVAIMANGTVRVGSCARIYGNILARKNFEGSAACGITDYGNAVVGNISTQNEGTALLTTFGSGTNIVVPAPNNNINQGGNTVAGSGLVVGTVELKWSRYK